MKVEKARIRDIAQIHRLVNYFADRGEMLPRALSELYENIRDLFVVRDGDEVIGCAAHHIFWSDLTEIRAVAVAAEKQDQGAGERGHSSNSSSSNSAWFAFKAWTVAK